MHIANVLPRNMNFGPLTASSIDLVARDFVRDSGYRQSTTVICRDIDPLFENFRYRTFGGGSTRKTTNQITSILGELKPDLIVIHQHVPTAAVIAARFPDIPVILHKHNYIKKTTGLRHYYHSKRYKDLAGIVFVSEALRTQFSSHTPDVRPELYVVHNGLPLADWPDDFQKKNEIVAVGFVHEKKGSLEIATALAQVLPDYPDWTARFFGRFNNDNGYGDRVQAVIDSCEQIISTGYIPFSEVVDATKRAQIAVVNSRNEPFGRVAIEAFAARTALICSVSGGLGEVIADAALGLKLRTPDEIAVHLRTLIENPQRRDQVARAGRARFEEKFTTEKLALKLDDIYETIHRRSKEHL